jgi:hypothetical protein
MDGVLQEGEQLVSVKEYLDRPASVGTDFMYAVLVGIGASVVAAALPLNWVPLIGPQAPGIAGGLVGGLFFYRARSNSPLNFGARS